MKKHPLLFTKVFVLCLVIVLSSCKKEDEELPQPQLQTVSIDGTDYPTVTIGAQVWTAVNHSGTGGILYNAANQKPEYGKYYTYEEAKAVPLPAGWRMPTVEDYKKLAESQGVVFTNDRATNQDAIKKLVSATNWKNVAGTNVSGFNAYPGGYCFQSSAPQDGDISELWTATGLTMSIMEGANGLNHNMMFYVNSNSPDYRFNLRFVKDK